MMLHLTKISCFRSNFLLPTLAGKNNVRSYGFFKSFVATPRSGNIEENLRKNGMFSVLRLFSTSSAKNMSNIIEINTNIVNNVILWKYENSKYFTRLFVFSIVQLAVFGAIGVYMSNFIPTFDKNDTFKDKLRKGGFPILFTVMPPIGGILLTILTIVFIRRSLKYIILNKGGKTATLVTYEPFGQPVSRTMKLDDIKPRRDKNDVGSYVALKVKDVSLYFLADKDGKWVNPDLYDVTVGLDRTPDHQKQKFGVEK